MAAIEKTKNCKEEILNNQTLTISKDSFFDTVRGQKGERILYLGEERSPMAAQLTSQTDVYAAVTASQIPEEGQVDAVVTQLGLHAIVEPGELLFSSYKALKQGGRIVADLVEETCLKGTGGFRYSASLSDYWSLLRQAGFQAVFVQQIRARSFEEVILQGWHELAEEAVIPIVVNRFLAFKQE